MALCADKLATSPHRRHPHVRLRRRRTRRGFCRLGRRIERRRGRGAGESAGFASTGFSLTTLGGSGAAFGAAASPRRADAGEPASLALCAAAGAVASYSRRSIPRRRHDAAELPAKRRAGPVRSPAAAAAPGLPRSAGRPRARPSPRRSACRRQAEHARASCSLGGNVARSRRHALSVRFRGRGGLRPAWPIAPRIARDRRAIAVGARPASARETPTRPAAPPLAATARPDGRLPHSAALPSRGGFPPAARCSASKWLCRSSSPC